MISYVFFLSSDAPLHYSFFFFFFNDTATTEIYTLSLHDALPIFGERVRKHLADHRDIALRRERGREQPIKRAAHVVVGLARRGDRKSTRLNSSHQIISYAVFCLKKKKQQRHTQP